MICCVTAGIGKVVEIKKDLNNNEYLLVEVERPFNNFSNIRETDIIPLYDWKDNCCKFKDYFSKDDIVAFKGRIETRELMGIVIVCEQLSIVSKK